MLRERKLEFVRLMDTRGSSLPAGKWAKNYWEIKLYRLKMKEDEDLNKHEKDFDQIIDKLRSLRVEIAEEEKTLIFLESLPDSFADAVKIVIHDTKKLTLAKAREQLKTIKVKLNLYRLEMKESEGLTKHEEDFDQIIEESKKLGVKMGEEQITLMFLASLPNSFADAVESVINAKEMLTLAQVRAKAGREWMKIKKELKREADNVKTRKG